MTTSDPGLRAQRTSLAWTRTSFAVLANGVLLMAKDIVHHRAGLGLVAAGVAFVVAVLTYLIGIRRQRILTRHAAAAARTRTEVVVVTVAVLVLIVVSIAAVVS